MIIYLVYSKNGFCQIEKSLFDTTALAYYEIDYPDSSKCFFYYLKDKKNTFCTECFHKNEQRSSLEFLNNNLRNGVFINWFENGSLEQMDSYVMGCLSGPSIKYYESGQIEEEGFYYIEVNDSIVYLNWFYSKDSILEQETTSTYEGVASGYRDKKDGVWKYYFSDGKLKRTEMWDKGLLIRKE